MSNTILLADDSLTIQKVVELTFADTDYDVVAVSGGDELLAKIPDCDPDVVICDVIMPGKDGYDVCQQIKSDPETLHIPVILLTGTFEPFDRDRALAVGCSDIITKPFEARKLVETVERLVEGGEGEAVTPPVPEPTAVTPPPDLQPDAAAAAPANSSVEDDFGTRLAEGPPTVEEEQPEPSATEEEGMPETAVEGPPPPPTGDGLDFTTTGFAEMEAAGEEQEGFVPPPPAEGLDFDEEGPESAEDLDEAAPPAGEDQPFESISDTDFDIGRGAEDDEAEQWPEAEEPAAEAEPAAEPTAPPPLSEPPETDSAATDPTMTVPISEYEDAFAGVAEAESAETAAAAGAGEPEAEDDTAEPPRPAGGEIAETSEEPSPWGEPAQAEEPESPAAEDSGDEPVVGEEPRTDEPPSEHDGEEDETSALSDTAPLSSYAAPAAAPAPSPAPPPTMLSDEDVDRIAGRVLELAADRLERIAWEVIPDMAEIVVRERIRELEAEVERAAEGDKEE